MSTNSPTLDQPHSTTATTTSSQPQTTSPSVPTTTSLLLSQQHIDALQCQKDLTNITPASILVLVAAADDDPSLLAKFKTWYQEIPEYPEDEAQNLTNQLSKNKRRGDKNDGFLAAKCLDTVYARTQRNVLKTIIDKCEALRTYKLKLLTKAEETNNNDNTTTTSLTSTNTSPPPSSLPHVASELQGLPPPPTPPPFRAYVGNLDPAFSPDEIRLPFSTIPGFKYIRQPNTTQGRTLPMGVRYAFAEFSTYQGLDYALRNQFTIRGKQITTQLPKDMDVVLGQWLTEQRKYEDTHNLPHSFVLPTDPQKPNEQQQQQQQQTSTISAPKPTPLQDIPENKLPPGAPTTGNVICIANMFSQQDKDEVSEDELTQEVQGQCSQYGEVTQVKLRLTEPINATDIDGVNHEYFPAFVQYTTHEQAGKALQVLVGLTFDQRRLYAYITDQIPQ